MSIRFFHTKLQKASTFKPNTVLAHHATVAYERVSKDTIKFAVAYCSSLDIFCKKQGRRISEGRLNKGKKVVEMKAAPSKALDTIKTYLGV